MTVHEMEGLLAEYFEGRLDEAGFARLDEMLASDPQAARRFEQLLVVEGALRARAAGAAELEDLRRRVMISVTPKHAGAGLARRVLSSLPSGRHRREGRHSSIRHRIFRPTPWVRYLVAPLAAAVLLLGIWIALSGPAPERRVVRKAPPAGVQGESLREESAPAPLEERTTTKTAAASASDGEAAEPREVTAAVRPEDELDAAGAPQDLVGTVPEPAVARGKADEDAPPARDRSVAREAAPAAGAHVGYLDAVEGLAEWQRAGAKEWSEATNGIALSDGDGLRTKLGRARIVYESGTILHLNRFTTIAMAGSGVAPGVTVLGGELYAHTVAGDKGFAVATEHGRAVDLGTRFGVKVGLAGTKVTVVEGTVRASTDVGSVVARGHQEVLLAKRTGSPGPVRRAHDAEARYAWATEQRTSGRGGLVALYLFNEGRGGVVHDVSGAGLPLDLRIRAEREGAVRWVRGGLAVLAPTVVIESTQPAAKIAEACMRSGEITVEAWLNCANPLELGPIRIVTACSPVDESVNFMLGTSGHPGQRPEGNFWMRYTTTTAFLKPALVSMPGTAQRGLTQVVFTRGANGAVRFYLDGAPAQSRLYLGGVKFSDAAGEHRIDGDCSVWSRDYHLTIVNRPQGDRQWLGEMRLVAIYDRALPPDEVALVHRAGPAKAGPRK